MTTESKKTNEPFSFKEILGADKASGAIALPAPQTVKASDGVELAVRVYRSTTTTNNSKKKKSPPCAILVFLHGGGAHSGAGYQHIGNGLSGNGNDDNGNDYGVAVYMPDLRGHGASGGPRGDAPNSEQVWNDVTTVIDYARRDYLQQQEGKENATTLPPLFLGGHSSGGGLAINYSTWSERRTDIAGYVLVSPQLGYESKTERPPSSDRPAFASVSILSFIVNGVTGFLGHSKAVRFSYPPEVLDNDAGLVAFNTINMANAITPLHPHDQFRTLLAVKSATADGDTTATTTSPVGLWVGEDDELFDANKVVAFVNDQTTIVKGKKETGVQHSHGTVIPGKNHLSILLQAHQPLGRWIVECT